jgi:predicted nucleic acid-binding protein
MLVDACLVDTNVLLRISKRSDPHHAVVEQALSRLAVHGAALYYTHQNIAELWNTMTRPPARNGFGLSMVDANQAVAVIESGMELLPDGPEVYREWRRIVVEFAVSGVQVHDARLAAGMYAHNIPYILTLNTTDFARFPRLSAVNPASV